LYKGGKHLKKLIDCTLGIDVLMRDVSSYVPNNSRVGLATNPTGVNYFLQSTVDLLFSQKQIQLSALFAFEHGIRGDKPADIKIDDTIDIETGLPVYSMYGEGREKLNERIKNIDVVVFDVQDLGVRYYTYISSLIDMLKACYTLKKRLVVLDRPNPMGCQIFGNILEKQYESFIGAIPMLTSTGMTIGEFAIHIQDTYYPPLDLKIVAMDNYNRNLWIDRYKYHWVAPSPNIPTIDSVKYYPITVNIEGTNLSEGRGTTRPFQIFGAPWLQVDKTIQALRNLELRGLVCNKVYFTPTESKFKGEFCYGIQLFIEDADLVDYTRTPYELLRVLRLLHKEFEWFKFPDATDYAIDYHFGTDKVRLAIDQGLDYSHFKTTWEQQQLAWKRTIRTLY